MTWDVRQHLQADLKTLASNVYGGSRTLGSAIPALVWRIVKLTRGEDIQEDDGTREATAEIVIWARDLESCLATRDLITARYHGTVGYEFGGRGEPLDPDYETPLTIDSSRITTEYDGDRVNDTFSDEGASALTVVVELQWTETEEE